MDVVEALTIKAGTLGLQRGNGRDPGLRGARAVRRGVFCVRRDREPTFEETVVAALLVLPAGTVACGLTAARLWRLDALVPVLVDEPLEFLVAGRRNSARLEGCRLHFEATTTVALPCGVPSTSKARTVIDMVARLDFADAVALTESAVHNDPDLESQLTAERRRRLPRRRREHVERVLDFAGALSESVLESHARVLWSVARLPVPIQQASVRAQGRFVARVDFLWPQARLVVEVDGLGKYREPGELQREKARQNALIAAGYTVLRFTWRDIHQQPDSVVRQVRAALRVSA